MNKLVLDLDDVLCHFVDAWCNWLHTNGFTDRKLHISEIKTYDHFMLFGKEAHDFYLKDPDDTYTNWIEPLEGSHQFVEWCHENFDEVMILSHAKTKPSQKAKEAFVRKHFNIKNIKFSDSKREKYLFTSGSILVDDYPLNLLKHIKHNDAYGVCFNRDGHNPWSTIKHHGDMIEMMQIDLSKYSTVTSYEGAQRILTAIKENE